jgi:hypothetical protein
MRPALDPTGHRVPRTKPTCLLHTWRPHQRRPFALVLHLHQHLSSRNLHLHYLAKNQSTQCCQSLITTESDHSPVLEPHMLSITHPPWWVHWQHPHIVTQEKRKRKEMNKKKLQQAIESQTTAKSKITWRTQLSDPLGKGNGSTYPRQNYAQAKSTNYQTKARKTTKSLPCTHESSTWTNATPPGRMHARHHLKQGSCNSPALTGQTGQHHRSDWCATCEQGQHSDRSDRWPWPVWQNRRK